MIWQLSVPSKICKQTKPRKRLNLAWNSHPSELIQPLLTASISEVMEHLDDYTQCLNNRMEVPQCGNSSHSQTETYLTYIRHMHWLFLCMGYLSTKGEEKKVGTFRKRFSWPNSLHPFYTAMSHTTCFHRLAGESQCLSLMYLLKERWEMPLLENGYWSRGRYLPLRITTRHPHLSSGT